MLIYNEVLLQNCRVYIVVKLSDYLYQWSHILFANSDLWIVVPSSTMMTRRNAGSTEALSWLFSNVCNGCQHGEGQRPTYLTSPTYITKYLKSKHVCPWLYYWPELMWLYKVPNFHFTYTRGIVLISSKSSKCKRQVN